MSVVHGIAWFLIATVVLAGYLLACWIWPFAACTKCKGRGKFTTSSGKAWRKCRRCKGSGERLRPGRHVIDYVRRLRAGAGK